MNPIRQEFENNLGMVQEDNPELPLQQQLKIAAEYTVEYYAGLVYKEQERRWGEYTEGVNKTFFE